MIVLQDGEEIISIVRKHWISLFFNAAVMLLLAILPIALVLYAQPFIVIPIHVIVFFLAAWVLFVWTMFVTMWTNYYLDVLILTNKRIVDMEQFILFSRDEVTIPIDRIEDVKIEVKGFLPTVLRYGNMQIQTAGANRETVMAGVHYPERIKQQIDALLQGLPRTRRQQNSPL